MTVCFIHIGMEKTGSTSIQRLLRDNRRVLGDLGIGFPLANSGRVNHNLLASSYIPADSERLSRGARSGRAARHPDFLTRHQAAILGEIGRSGRVVISGEHLFRLTADEVGAFKRDLQAAGATETRVFGVLRAPASFYLSFVQQELKGSSTFPSPADFFVPYSERAQAWLAHFDSRFFDFQSLVSSPLGIVEKFVGELEDFFGVKLSGLERGTKLENDSLSPEEMQLVQDFRRRWFPNDDGQLNRSTTRLVEALRRHRDEHWRKPVLRPEVGALISAHHLAEAARLSALTGVTFNLSSAAESQVAVSDVSGILANYDPSLYAQLLRRTRPARYLDLPTRLATLTGWFADRPAASATTG